MTNKKINISNKIIAIRVKHNLTQQQLADKIGVSRHVVTSWEKKKSTPNIEQLNAISIKLCISHDWIFENSNHKIIKKRISKTEQRLIKLIQLASSVKQKAILTLIQ